MQTGLLAHQLFDGIDGVQALLPEVLVVPGVLADGDGQPQAVQLDHLLRPRRSEVTLLVEDIVEGQKLLVLFEQETPAIEQDCGVDGGSFTPANADLRGHRLRSLTLCRKGHACQHGGGQIAGGCGQFIDGSAATSQETRLFQEVGGRVTAKNQLGEDGEPRALSGRATAGRNNLFKISGEISDSLIDLGQRDLHSSSLIEETAISF